jgi:hypothetical protein
MVMDNLVDLRKRGPTGRDDDDIPAGPFISRGTPPGVSLLADGQTQDRLQREERAEAVAGAHQVADQRFDLAHLAGTALVGGDEASVLRIEWEATSNADGQRLG